MHGGREDDSFDLIAINEVLRGDPEAFGRLVEKYQDQLLHLAFSYLGDSHAAEDAVQDIFIRVYSSLGKFSISKRFHPWFYSIAVNHLKNLYRRNKTGNQVPLFEYEMKADEYPPPEELLEKNEDIRRIRKAVMMLPGSIREPLILYYFEDLKISEISEILKISAENVKSKLFRGRKKIRKYLTE